MELRHLRYFLMVAEEGQLTRAAARLHIQQPPLSQQIHEFERELGFPLFRRLPRGVELTAAGSALRDDVRHVFATLTQGIDRARRIADGHAGEVRVALTSSVAFHPLAPVAIRAFREAYPDISVELEERNAAEIIDAMTAGLFDVALLRKPSGLPEDLSFEVLLEENMVLVLPRGHALDPGNRPSVALEALRDERFILVRRPGAAGMYADFIRACEQIGFTPKVVNEVARMVTAINLVATGAGVTLVPASMQRYRQENVVYCAVTGDDAFTAPVHLVTRRDSANAAAQRFAEVVKRTTAA